MVLAAPWLAMSVGLPHVDHRDVRWGDDLPSGTASLDDLAYAVVDSGLRSRRVDGAFFDSRIVEFPRFRPEITKIQQIMLDAT